ncbi:arsenite efflux transporter metallochaperone ArsD [Clostridium sp. SHJSY1]|uniref:arsenite efflux transporter metallochaperone ArsD n=1 Tax=Clostridium sp. SHJSY1 TaxID=2942483 RepID=UPI002876CFEC|nr:arsenite efflux transporter metallochaperone ArsD [Clostridium sp. SHJSY1]MDS0526735.1 arsenite efflux transporter metallochaperone ArsD [Clostridium sp. SHJSY1]
MKKMTIFDPAMCCSTGVCGPSVNKELLRVATTINTLKNKGVEIERYNLSNNPQFFVDNKEINEILNTKGVDALPVIIVDGVIVKEGSYPTNEEFCNLLEIPTSYLEVNIKMPNNTKKPNKGCGCKGGC